MSEPNVVKYASLIDLIIQKAEDKPDFTAFKFLVDGGDHEKKLTYGDLDRFARILAIQLRTLSASGERALLLYPPGLDYITAFIGCLYAGIIAVPAYPPDLMRLDRSLPRLMAIISDARPKFCLTTSTIFQLAQTVLLQNPDIHEMMWIATDDLSWESDLQAWKYPEIHGDTLAFLQYTSGSTSDPKGVKLSHNNLLANLAVINHAFELDPNTDRGMFWLPLYHDMGLIGAVLETLYTGVSTTLMSPLDFLQQPYRWLKAISRHRITISGGPNFAYDLCVRKVTSEQKANLDLSCWQLAVNGAEPVYARTLDQFASTFASCGFQREAFYPCYGLAEATLFVTGPKRWTIPHLARINSNSLAINQIISEDGESQISTLLVSCGKPGLGHEVIIVNPETLEPQLPDDKGLTLVGEIWVSGPSVAQGYWNRPEDSCEILEARLQTDSSRHYLRTGDLGFLVDGELYITGRIKDLIIIDGFNHYPQDIERAVELSHPALRVGCSVAFSVEINGQERLVVVAEMKDANQIGPDQAHLDQDQLIASVTKAIRQTVVDKHDLSIYQVVLLKPGSIPKTSSGKIQRRACREEFLNGKLKPWGRKLSE
jgi:acyl-CoA synthetase (AMP-forming)/AMP-acid ligase II